MRGRIGWWWVCVGLALSVVARPAEAGCQACNSDMWCASTAHGGTVCLGTGDWCAMAGRCGGGSPSVDDVAFVQVSLLDDAAGAAGEPARVTRGFGPLSVGDHARRAGRGANLRFSAVGVIDGASAAFRAPAGDGFVLSREGDGRGARVVVRTLEGDRPGRALADERLGEHDVLRVRVPFDGRECVLVVQAATLPAPEGREREQRCRREIARVAPAIVNDGLGRVPFELRALDE